MKKLCIGLLLTIFSTQYSQADTCRDYYRGTLKAGATANMGSDLGPIGTTAFIAGGATVIAGIPAALFTGALAGSLIPAGVVIVGVGAYEGYIGLANIKEKNMIKLIDQAVTYDLYGGVPGKKLRKLFKIINKKRTLTMSELASFLREGNENGSLCSSNESFKDIAQAIKSGDVELASFK